MKYKICSYKLQDGRWVAAFMPQQPVSTDSSSAIFSEPTELGVYFQSKKEADECTHKYLIDDGISVVNITIEDKEQNNTNNTFEL